jgi:hypothetical protein
MSRTPNNSINDGGSHAALLSLTTQPCMQTNSEYRRSSVYFAQTLGKAAAEVKIQMAEEEERVSRRRDSACDSSEELIVR